MHFPAVGFRRPEAICYDLGMRRAAVVFTCLSFLSLTGCPGTKFTRPYKEPDSATILAHLDAAKARSQSYQAESVMDYWLGDDRVKGTVLVMGKAGARVRFNALNPTGGTVAADLACDGDNFTYIDFNKNCQLTGPCNAESIASLLRVSLEPDDFLLLAMGTTPYLSNASAKSTWNSAKGQEIVDLRAPDGQTQRIIFDGRDARWDVVSSVAKDAAGKEMWRLENIDFAAAKDEAGNEIRLPGKTRFRQPGEKADLIVEWKRRKLNLDLAETKFQMTPPEGLPYCQ